MIFRVCKWRFFCKIGSLTPNRLIRRKKEPFYEMSAPGFRSGAFTIHRSDLMNELLKKFNEYRDISNYRIKYILDNGDEIDFKLKQTDFPHLIGLHKLVDIPLIGQFNDNSNTTVSAKFLISKIKKESQLTDKIIKGSIYFSDIQQRYENFSRENLLTITYTDAIVNFNASLIGSKLNGDYILYENRKNKGYNYLSIARDINKNRYVESFFYNPSDIYIHNQIVVKVKKVEIFDNKGNLYLEDYL